MQQGTPLLSRGMRYHIQREVARKPHTACRCVLEEFQQHKSRSVLCQRIKQRIPNVVLPTL